VLGEVPLKDRLYYIAQCRLYHSISDHRYSQGSFFGAARLWYPDSFNGCRLIALLLEFLAQLVQVLFLPGLELLYTLAIDSGAASVAPYLVVGASQGFFPVDLIDQRKPFSSFDPSFEGPQHTIGPDRVFHPLPSLP
jgi:hypothetical protein